MPAQSAPGGGGQAMSTATAPESSPSQVKVEEILLMLIYTSVL